jgi:intron-binding protein aquarius
LKAEVESLKVSTYKPPNNGPYPVDAPKVNTVRFTPAQIEAITSGTQPGLTLVVGPPGTGKTDVATQIINNIYHNFPEQRTLLIAHSNQALNQLYAKIVALDIDERHLLRLGHGEEELDTEGNFSKHGRVESFLENRDRYLQEVTRLAASIGAPGAHGNSAETAGYFNSVYVLPAWSKFTELTKSEDASPTDIVAAFPFYYYFSNAPQPLFPPEADRQTVMEIANGCYRHISKIFSELADALPFEILRRDREKANYLLTNEARIVAMTSTHAGIKRGEIAQLGFHYDNVVMEEAAQITEIENFIPFTMQKPKDGKTPLQRVVLCGDHLQNSPIVQNLAFRDFANLEQSLFSRLVRLGVPTITLDQQGRARPSIARLYQWRYPQLGNLPHVDTAEEFLTANAGFKYDYQFINVGDYKGKGESEPSPHFVQNLGEAEYAVAIFQYMRLLGYPASKISILTTYSGQRALIRDVLNHRCAKSPIFGMPKIVVTVDKYQGEQNDCK